MANYCTTHYVVEGKRETLEKIKESLGHIVETVQKVSDLLTQYKDDIKPLQISINTTCGFDEVRPYMSIPLAENVYVRGNMRMTSLATDAMTISSFAQEMKLILEDSASKGIRFEISNQDRLWR